MDFETAPWMTGHSLCGIFTHRNTTVNMTRTNKETIEVVTVSEQRRRRWSAAEKAALVRQTYEPGMSVSLVARQHGVAASQLFNWRKLEREGALTAVSAGESVVPASELASARAQIAQLQRLLGKKTMEAEILREAVELAREKKWIARKPLLRKDDQ
ncbi:MAG: transposase [Herminiimonas sp.]|nr:transposase [Herminiimonas sp.]